MWAIRLECRKVNPLATSSAIFRPTPGPPALHSMAHLNVRPDTHAWLGSRLMIRLNHEKGRSIQRQAHFLFHRSDPSLSFLRALYRSPACQNPHTFDAQILCTPTVCISGIKTMLRTRCQVPDYQGHRTFLPHLGELTLQDTTQHGHVSVPLRSRHVAASCVMRCLACGGPWFTSMYSMMSHVRSVSTYSPRKPTMFRLRHALRMATSLLNASCGFVKSRIRGKCMEELQACIDLAETGLEYRCCRTKSVPECTLSSSSMSLPQTLTATVSTPLTALYTGTQSQRWSA